MAEFIKSTILVITQKSARLRESGLLDECAPQIQSSRSGQALSASFGSIADFWGITRTINL